jgi:response regulator RpfG family c-di-GMP phosphodiesterase
MGQNILLVDDEKAVLKALQRSLAASRFNIFLAENGAAALDIMAGQPIDIIISDMRMPRMDGHQLLRQVKDLYPATARLILSGYAEEKTVIRAMLDGSCKMYLMKPWDNQQLTTIISQLLTTREILSGQPLRTVIDQLASLPTLDEAYKTTIGRLTGDADIRQIAASIEQDQPTAAKILEISSHAFCGLKPGSVAQALSYLGLTALRGLILAACCQPADGSGLSGHTVWRQSCLTNRLVGSLHRRLLGRPVADAAVTAGLLADIGRLLAVDQFPDRYRDLAAAQNPAVTLSDRERQSLGASHQEIGGYLLDRWNLPQPIIECTLFHHDPLSENILDRQLVALVHVAGHYAGQALGASLTDKLDPRVFGLLGTDQPACEAIIAEILAK